MKTLDGGISSYYPGAKLDEQGPLKVAGFSFVLEGKFDIIPCLLLMASLSETQKEI